MDDLGIGEGGSETSKFYPIHRTYEKDVDFYWKKLHCFDDEAIA